MKKSVKLVNQTKGIQILSTDAQKLIKGGNGTILKICDKGDILDAEDSRSGG